MLKSNLKEIIFDIKNRFIEILISIYNSNINLIISNWKLDLMNISSTDEQKKVSPSFIIFNQSKMIFYVFKNRFGNHTFTARTNLINDSCMLTNDSKTWNHCQIQHD